MKRVLVTGATGGLGRNSVEFLLSKGLEVVATGRNQTVGEALQAAGALFVPADLTRLDGTELARLAGNVDAIWHCAALSSPWGAYAEFYSANVQATRNLLGVAQHSSRVKHFIHISTPALYFDYQHHLNVPESYAPTCYVNHYARTKALTETEVLRSASAHPHIRHTLLRPRAIFGPYDQVLLPRLQSLLSQRNGRLPLPRKGRTVLDMTYVENVCHAMWLASTVPQLPSGCIFNVTNDDPRAVGSVLHQLFASELKLPFEVQNVPYPLLSGAARMLEQISVLTKKEPKLTRYSIGALAYDMTLDLSAIKQLLGYQPIVSMDEGICKTADWLRQHG